MKVLVATRLTQGECRGDVCFCREGEMVYFKSWHEAAMVDNNCGGCRFMVGLNSRKATTTVKCVLMKMPKGRLVEKIEVALHCNGWMVPNGTSGEMADRLICFADGLDVGKVYEYRYDKFIERPIPTK